MNKISDCVEYYSSTRNNFFNEKPKFDQAVKIKATNISLKFFKKLKDKEVYTSSLTNKKKQYHRSILNALKAVTAVALIFCK